MTKRQPIAVVGVSTLFPGSVDATGFWKDILAGNSLITDVPATHWLVEDYYDPDPSAPDKTYANRGAFLPEVDFDPMHWGVPPSTVQATDTCQLLALIVAQRVLSDAARGQFDYADRDRMSVILGVTSSQELLGSMVSRLQRPIWTKALRDMGLGEDEVQEACERIESHYTPWQEATFPGVLGNVVAGRIANRLDLGGTNCVTDAACASTFSALSMAVNELWLGESDVVICGGADTMNDIFMYLCFSKTPALSRSGDCRPFSDKADGTMLGEGFGMVALKRLSDAERDGDRVYAVVTGVGSSSDGKGTAVYAPVAAGQAKAIRRAYERAGYGPDTVELVEAHGTGTIAGDAAEFEGLRMVFDESGREDRQWCALGSIKSQIGHTKAAAGAAGLVKAVFSLHHRVLPPTIKVDAPNPKLNLPESPFYLNTRARPWIRDEGHPRRAGVSSFGFGGSNFHIALEEYTGPADPAYRRRASETELIVLSADSREALAADARKMAGVAPDAGMFEFLARSSQEGYDAAAACRLAVVASDGPDLAKKLERAAERVAVGEPFSTPDGTAFGAGAPAGDVGFLFPGQGSQYVSMGAQLAMAWDAARAPWDDASNLDAFAEPLHQVVFPRPGFTDEEAEAQADKLTATEWAQPGIGVTSLSQLALLEQIGVSPSAVAGHSFGEVTALCAAGALDRDSALRVALRRGELMAEAAANAGPEGGAMTAVSASVDEVRGLLQQWDLGVVVANHNGPAQVVISGRTPAIEQAEQGLAAAGLRFRRLRVATAFHSDVVSASTAPFADFLSAVSLSAPRCDVYGNTKAAPYPTDPTAMRALLANQLANPVRFVEMVQAMHDAGVRTFVEVGPGSVLTGLTARILEGRPHRALSVDRKGKDGLTSFNLALGQLVAEGVPMNLGALWTAFEPVEDPRTATQPKMTMRLTGANYAKPYPPPNGAAGVPAPNPPRTAPVSPAPSPIRPPTAAQESQNMSEYRDPPRAAAAPPPPSAPQQAAPAPYVPQPQTAGTDAWASAYYAIQARVIDAHTAYTQAIAATHGAFIAAQQQALGAIPQLVGQPAYAQPQYPHYPQPQYPSPQFAPQYGFAPHYAPPPYPMAPPPMPPPPAPYPAQAAPSPMPMAAPPMAAPPMAAPPVAAPAPVPPAPAAPVAPALVVAAPVVAAPVVAAPVAAAPVAAAPAVDLQALMLEVVAAKTGYPVEMLELSMDLEGDLGVDSIKRVEILAAMREQAADLPEVDPAELGKLRTLQEIVDRMGGSNGAAPTEPSSATGAGEAAAGEVDLQALMLEVVAEKTGYPVEMLELSMDLEGDLGVDSIKRVEILAAMRERASDLPEVDPAELGKLRTLKEIVERMEGPSVASAGAREERSSTSPAAPGRWALRLDPAPANGFALDGLLTAKSIAVVDGGSGLAVAVAERLAARGVAATASAPGEASDGVIFLGGLADPPDTSAAMQIQRDAFSAAKSVAARLSKEPGVFVTVQDTGGTFGLDGVISRPWLGGLPGLVKTAAQEWPHAGVRAVDLERGGRSPEELATAVADELLRGGDARRDGASGGGAEIALRADGARATLVSYPAAVAKGAARLDASSVVLASGGARGVTATTLIALARARKSRFVLLGRTPLEDEPAGCADAVTDAQIKSALLGIAKAAGEPIAPKELQRRAKRILAGREVRSTLDAIERAGGQARYFAADVQDVQALTAALSEVRADWGPVTAIVHGAGVLADRFIADKTAEDFDRVFDVKVKGLQALLSVTADDPLEVLFTFSSVAARCGNRGQCDYAMANETLNMVVASEALRRGPAFFARSLGWGPWEGGMVTPALKQHFESLGVPLIPLDVGAKMLVDELSDSSGSLQLVLGGEPRPEALASAPGGAVGERHYDVLIHESTFPSIADHRIKGKPVLPVALVIELFARAVSSARPDLVFTACEDVEVLKGVMLQDYEGRGDRLRVRVSPLSNGDGVVLRLRLLDASGRVRYSARGSSQRKPLAAAKPLSPPEGLGGFVGPVYDGELLFHGPRFRVIEGAPKIGPDGLEATLHSAQSLGWPAGAWVTDPALVDGGLQLALLWTCHGEGGTALPTAVKRFVRFSVGLVSGPVRAVLVGASRTATKNVCDVMLTDAQGNPVAALYGVQTFVLPGSRPVASARA